MNRLAHQFMYLNLAAVLLAVLFVLQPSSDADTAAFRSEVREQVAAAAGELWGEGSPAGSLALVWNGLAAFYGESADQTLAMLTPSERMVEWALAFDSGYQVSREIAASPMVTRPPNEPPIYNIVPSFNEGLAYQPQQSGIVAGESLSSDPDTRVSAVPVQPVEPHRASWINLTDSITGASYCVAVFNGELNSYAGPCAKDEQYYIYEN